MLNKTRRLRLLRLCPTLPEIVQYGVVCLQITRKCITNRILCPVVEEQCETSGPYRVEPKLDAMKFVVSQI